MSVIDKIEEGLEDVRKDLRLKKSNVYDINGVVVDLAEVAIAYSPKNDRIVRLITKGGGTVDIGFETIDQAGLNFLAIKEKMNCKGVLKV